LLQNPLFVYATCGVFLSSCASPMLSPIALDHQTIDYQAGNPTMVSRKTSVVALTILSAEVKTHAFVAISVANRSKAVATIDATDVTADSGGQSLRVYTAAELEHIARVQKGWAIAAAVLGAAAGAAAANIPATTYTNGSVYGANGARIGGFNATATTYNPAAATVATAAVTANAQAQVAGIENAHQQREGQIAGVLQLTTVYPNQAAGGVVEIDKNGMADPINVHVRFAGERHDFALHFMQGGQPVASSSNASSPSAAATPASTNQSRNHAPAPALWSKAHYN
jgi:hypothetical protein